MGATIELYRLSNAKFKNEGLYAISNKEFEAMSEQEFLDLWETRNTDRWGDGEDRLLIDITQILGTHNEKGGRRAKERLERLPIQKGPIDFTGNIHGYIVADQLACYGGSNLNRRYYKKKNWLVVCTTQKETIRFFERYGLRGSKETLENILSQWDEKTFLLISY